MELRPDSVYTHCDSASPKLEHRRGFCQLQLILSLTICSPKDEKSDAFVIYRIRLIGRLISPIVAAHLSVNTSGQGQDDIFERTRTITTCQIVPFKIRP
jgi:hypothetical protein